MSSEGDYEALEKSVRYIPWKGKKEEWYTWHKTFLVRALIHGYHGVLVGLEEVPTDDKAKVLALTASTNLMSDQKNQYNNYKMNTRAYADLLQCCIQDIVFSELLTQRRTRTWQMAIRHSHGNDCQRNSQDATMLTK